MVVEGAATCSSAFVAHRGSFGPKPKIFEEVIMYGWKGRIGLLIPHRTITPEPEFNRMAPEGVSIHTGRFFFEEPSPAALLKTEEEIYRAAPLVAGVNPDVIVVACTSATLIKGFGYDQKLIEEITHLTGVATTTTSTAVIEALKFFKITKVAVATPYIEEVNQKEKEFLEAHGIRVTRIKGLGYSKSITSYPLSSKPISPMGLLQPSVAYKLARDTDTPDADGIFISCTGFRTIEIIEELERDTGKPVVTSNQASMAMALKMMGIKEKIRGFGSLLEGSFY
jgi:maleate isomerase